MLVKAHALDESLPFDRALVSDESDIRPHGVEQPLSHRRMMDQLGLEYEGRPTSDAHAAHKDASVYFAT